jgi:GTP-binding protein HflX
VALDLNVVETAIAPLRTVTPATLFGKGKIEEFAAICEVEKIDVAVFDDQLTPVQQRNLERGAEREGRRPHGPDPRDLRPTRPYA